MNTIDQNIYNKDIEFVGSKGLVFIGDKIVVFRRDTKTERFPLQIDLPGGGREGRETPFEVFKREVMEEFGLKIDRNDITYAKKYPSAWEPDKDAYFIVVKPKGLLETDIKFGDEGLEYMLMTPAEYVNLSDAIERQQIRVREYLNFI